MPKHPNVDRLDICGIEGWSCITQKDTFNIGDHAIYIPIDSILPLKLEEHLFPPDSKITINKNRIKTIKMRGAISQGMLLNIDSLISHKFLPPANYNRTRCS